MVSHVIEEAARKAVRRVLVLIAVGQDRTDLLGNGRVDDAGHPVGECVRKQLAVNHGHGVQEDTGSGH